MLKSAFHDHKHMFRVVESGGFRPTCLFFKCESCLANVWVTRSAWYEIVVHRDKRLTKNDLFPGEWRVCYDEVWHPSIPPEQRLNFAGW